MDDSYRKDKKKNGLRIFLEQGGKTERPAFLWFLFRSFLYDFSISFLNNS